MNTSYAQQLKALPPQVNLETVEVYKALAAANRALGELKGKALTLPNQNILIDTLFLQEALASSEIENIVTTQDEVFRADLFADTGPVEAKEVTRYRDAMKLGYNSWCENGFISENMLIEMFRILKQRNDGYRTTPGTVLRNARGETVYTPPQDAQDIVRLMRDLEAFINAEPDDLDPLIRMALIHHQFESIHPFPDGNGRVGRMLNVLYLTHAGLLDAPILYLSRAINHTKPDYYLLLRAVRNEGVWQEWVIYMLDAVTETAFSTLRLVEGIRDLMRQTKIRLREEGLYTQELLNNLFRHPYTRIAPVARDLRVHYNTAASRLKQLATKGFVQEVREGRNNYYINEPLVALFVSVSGDDNLQEHDKKRS
ncbi:MAG: Fic family protein [Parvularculales bacterium]